MGRLGAVAGAIVVLTSVAACDEAVAGEPSAQDSLMLRVFDEAALEGPDGVQKILVDDYQLEDVESVDCPADQEVRDGATFTCTVTVAGEELTVEITVTDEVGTYQVGLPE